MNLPGPETNLPNKTKDMQLKFNCPACASVLEIPRARTGVEGPCPVCGATIIAPSVVMPPPRKQETPAPETIKPFPAVPVSPPEPEPLASEAKPSLHTKRLWDLPPRPVFRAHPLVPMPESETAGVEETTSPHRCRSTRLRPLQRLRKELWFILFLWVIAAVAAAFVIYSDRMFEGFPSTPSPVTR
jgi:hypothetical protein